MSLADRQRWDEKYAAKAAPEKIAPDAWLCQQVSLPPGRALELACGLGQNAIWLAQRGWQVDAVDISVVGLRLAADLARRQDAQVHWIAADLDEFLPLPGAYDLVCVFRFLDRARLPERIVAALRPGGRLIYETYTARHLARPDSHLRNPAFALAPGELPRLFPALDVLHHEECDLPDRSVARLVAIRTDAGTARRSS